MRNSSAPFRNLNEERVPTPERIPSVQLPIRTLPIRDGTPLSSFWCDEKLKNKDMECVICLDNFQENECIVVLPCAHMFHYTCLDQWFLRDEEEKCPLCSHSLIID